jgi:hypothetical protein
MAEMGTAGKCGAEKEPQHIENRAAGSLAGVPHDFDD